MSPKSSDSVVSYVLLMQERLNKLRDLVTHNLQHAQNTQKQWYDKHARDRHFRPCDQVLILLPTTSNKLLVEWQGPYTITRKLGKVNYEVRMPEKRKRLKIFHANMLRQWHSPTALSCWANKVSEDDSAGEDNVTWSDPDNNSRPVWENTYPHNNYRMYTLSGIHFPQ